MRQHSERIFWRGFDISFLNWCREAVAFNVGKAVADHIVAMHNATVK